MNPTCSAYTNYLRHGRIRTNSPTEQLSMQSNYFQNWDLSAKVDYTGGDMNVADYFESLAGREARTNLFDQTNTGPQFGRHVSASADFGATWHITDRLSFLDSFHYANWHNPTEFDDSSCSFFRPNLLANPNLFTPTATLPISDSLRRASERCGGDARAHDFFRSGLSFAVSSLFLKQDEKTNLAEFEYQISSKLGRARWLSLSPSLYRRQRFRDDYRSLFPE